MIKQKASASRPPSPLLTFTSASTRIDSEAFSRVSTTDDKQFSRKVYAQGYPCCFAWRVPTSNRGVNCIKVNFNVDISVDLCDRLA